MHTPKIPFLTSWPIPALLVENGLPFKAEIHSNLSVIILIVFSHYYICFSLFFPFGCARHMDVQKSATKRCNRKLFLDRRNAANA